VSEAGDSPETRHLKALGRKKAEELTQASASDSLRFSTLQKLLVALGPLLGVAGSGGAAVVKYQIDSLHSQTEKQWEKLEKLDERMDALDRRITRLEPR
jgi:cell division protein FtsB